MPRTWKHLIFILLLLTAVALSSVTIYEIQYTTVPGSSGYYPSLYSNQIVTTQGIVTATGYSSNSGYYISMPEGGAWRGILVYDTHSPALGSLLTITGQVYEYNGLTEIRSVTNYVVESTGNVVPAATLVTTALAASEAYEGVLVELVNATVTSVLNTSNRWAVSDGSGNCTINGMFFNQSALSAQITLGALFDSIKGIGHYSASLYNVNPRTLDDVVAHAVPPANPEVVDTLSVIQRPLLNIPVIVIPGETFTIECVAAPSTTGWTAWLYKGNLIYSLPIINTQYASSPPRWILTAQVPDVNVFELYDLRVTANGGINDRTRHSVHVLPTRKSNYYFAQVTDVHMPSPIFSPTTGYDTDSTGTVDFREVIKDFNIIRPEFVLLTGDLVNEGELEDYNNVREFTKAKRLLGELEVPVYLIAGNHDIGGWDSTPPPAGTARKNWWKNFGWSWLNNSSTSWPYHTQDYSFDYGQLHFVGMEGYNNSGNYDDYLPAVYGTDSYTAGQMQWLQGDLAASGAPTKVLFQHYDFSDQIDLSSMGLDMSLAGHMHSDSGSLTTQPYDLLTDNLGAGSRAYRIVRVNGTALQPYSSIRAGNSGEKITISYNPSNAGTADSVNAYLVNDQAISFENSLVKFIMPSGSYTYTVTGGTLEQVNNSGSFNVCYVKVNLAASSSATVTINTHILNVQPSPPAQLTTTHTEAGVLLSWQAVTTDINGSPLSVTTYIIEASNEPYTGFTDIGFATVTNFTDSEATDRCRFYRVRAVAGSR
jgi:hypothetical protein